MDSSTENNPNPLSDYETGWREAITEAMRIIGKHYVSDFMDPFRIPPPNQPLIMVKELRELRDNPPRKGVKPTRIKHAK
jgi:hypothetical protein